jgi:hypothetical protein
MIRRSHIRWSRRHMNERLFSPACDLAKSVGTRRYNDASMTLDGSDH